MKFRYSTVVTTLVYGLGLSFVVAVISLVLVLFSPALAQNTQPPTPGTNPCTGLPAAPPYYADLDLAKPWPACVSPGLPRLDANSVGIVAWRWCRLPTGKHGIQWATLPWADFAAQPLLALKLNAAGLSMNEEALRTVTAEYAALIKPLAHPTNAAIWCPAWPKIVATRPSDVLPPSAATHIVAKNGTSSTRPTYLVLSSGRRALVSNGAVPVGADCNITGGITETPLVFGFPSGGPPGSVALCVKKL